MSIADESLQHNMMGREISIIGWSLMTPNISGYTVGPTHSTFLAGYCNYVTASLEPSILTTLEMKSVLLLDIIAVLFSHTHTAICGQVCYY